MCMVHTLHKKCYSFITQKKVFLIKGRAEDAKKMVGMARVCLAPLRFGAGIKGKLVEAMQCGTPSVTTSIGAESMHGDLQWNGMVADDVHEFSKNAVKLYLDEELWKQSQKNGIEIINKLYDKKRIGKRFLTKISNIQDNIEKHRMQNFTGAMLLHHTMQSTKYMSRWIAAKNV